MQFLLPFIVVFFFCAGASCHATEQSHNWIVKLLHPLGGVRICSNEAASALGFIMVNPQAWHDATISASIDEIVVWTFTGARHNVWEGFPFLEFPLLRADVNLVGKMLQRSPVPLRIAVFDDSGEDLQPEILSEFHIVPCQPPSSIEFARKSLIITQACVSPCVCPRNT
jgi:hypothetical protein